MPLFEVVYILTGSVSAGVYPSTCGIAGWLRTIESLTMENVTFDVGTSWPSLYNPAKEILHIVHRPPTQQGAHYLYHPHGECLQVQQTFTHFLIHLVSEIFRFTLYWTLIFSLPLYFLCGIFAFFNITFPPHRHSTPLSNQERGYENTIHRITPPKPNKGRSRLTFAILVLFSFLTLSLLNAVIGAAVVGYVLAGLFQAAKYNMSTCVSYAFLSLTLSG